LALVAILLVLFYACGSGGKSDEEKAKERELSMFGQEGLVEAEVVIRAYDAGRLGTKEEVAADMDQYFNPQDSDSIPKPLDDQGQFIPFGEMTNDQAYAFSEWADSEKVNDVIGPEKQAAIVEFRESQEKDGDDK
jgi:hypothetical protein